MLSLTVQNRSASGLRLTECTVVGLDVESASLSLSVHWSQVGMLADRYAFLVDWLDVNSGITWKYQLLYFPEHKEVEMVSSQSQGTGSAAIIDS